MAGAAVSPGGIAVSPAGINALPGDRRGASAEHPALVDGRPHEERDVSAALWSPAMRYSKIALRHPHQPQARAIGSAGERLVHTEEVTGSIPVSPTQVRAAQTTYAAIMSGKSCDAYASRCQLRGVQPGNGAAG